MDKNQALEVFFNQIPATGEVDYETVENAMRATSQGREAIRYFHQLRRSGAIVARITPEGGFKVSRPAVKVG